MFDGRPNSELILATGRVEDDSPSDYLTISVGLVQTDRMFSTKKEILQAMGFNSVQVCRSLPLLKCQSMAARTLAGMHMALEVQYMSALQEFPVYRERMPIQLLAYLRLARLTDPALLAKVRDGVPSFPRGA